MRNALAAGTLLLFLAAPVSVWAHTGARAAAGAEPRRVDLAAGTFAGVALGQTAAAARRALPGSVAGSASRATPLDAPSARIGVSYVPSAARSIRARGVSVITEGGRVRMLFVTDRRAVTLGGVGVGVSLRRVRARLSGLSCRQANENVPACGGRVGHSTVLFVGDPVETITLASIDTGWCFVRSDTCHGATRTVQIVVR